MPALQPALEAARIEAAARRAAAFLDDTRRRSVLDRVALTVRCRPDDRRLEVQGGSGGDAAFEIPPEVTRLSCTPEQMRYLPQGSAEGMTLVLRDARGRGRRLTVGAFTGLTRVEAEP